MYKSSPLTPVFKYLFPVFLIFGAGFNIYNSRIHGNPDSLGFTKGIIVITIWISYFLFQALFRLKIIEATDSDLMIKEFKKQTIIQYKDVHWITKFDISCPLFITIKYREKESAVDKKISFMPLQADQRPFTNDAISEFIKDKIKVHNPNYSKDTQPSVFKNILILTLLGLPYYY